MDFLSMKIVNMIVLLLSMFVFFDMHSSDEIDSLNNLNHNLSEENSTLKDKIVLLKKQLKELDKQLKESLINNHNLGNDMLKVNEENQNLKRDISKLDEEKQKLLKEYKELDENTKKCYDELFKAKSDEIQQIFDRGKMLRPFDNSNEINQQPVSQNEQLKETSKQRPEIKSNFFVAGSLLLFSGVSLFCGYTTDSSITSNIGLICFGTGLGFGAATVVQDYKLCKQHKQVDNFKQYLTDHKHGMYASLVLKSLENSIEE